MSNDLGFLIIFIILPTALIVSGFWLFLFVRRDSTRRQSAIVETETLATVPAASSDTEVVDSDTEQGEPHEEPHSNDVQDPAPPIFDPVEADAVDEIVTLDPEPEAEGAAVVDDVQDAPDDASFARSAGTDEPLPPTSFTSDDETPYRGHTEELLPVPEHLEASARAIPDHSGEVEDLGNEPEEPLGESSVSGDTANLPDELADQPEVDDASDTEDEPDHSHHQRAAMMVPSTENVKRRTSTTGRRVPQISRSNPRDEDPVEGSDGS